MCEADDDRRQGYRRLAQIAADLEDGVNVHVITVRELLQWFGAEGHDDRTVSNITEALRHLDLRTEPWFDDQWEGGPLEFHKGYFGGTHVPEIEK
jgi:hypothetical protein